MSGVLFQVRNRRGLGHQMRVRNLAEALGRTDPPPAVHVHCSVPPAPEAWNASIGWSAATDTDWLDVVAAHRPEVVVYDTVLPEDPRAGLLPGTRVAFVARRRAEDRRAELRTHPGLGAIDLVVVPHAPHELPDDDALPRSLAPVTHVVGPIVRRPDPSVGAELARRVAASPGPLVVSTAGGGGFGEETARFVRIVARAHVAMRARRPDLRHVVVLGPNHGGDTERLRALPGITVVAACPHLIELLAVCDLAITEAGYNTINELRLCATPAVVVPARRGLDDQFERAAALAEIGAASVVGAHDTAETAAELAVRLLDGPGARAAQRTAHTRHPVEPGNDRAAQLIRSLCHAR